ncbi:MAG: hypothetical protein MI924_29050 [Chloroflexales bacterium]|nr:hypothetical protein [Chloroflexales bacterium]
MTMAPFFQYFPDIAAAETRSAHVSGMPGLPDGECGFFESYCVEPSCDCRRVLVNVVRADIPNKILATINYGWESAKFYGKWLGNMADAVTAKGSALDPFNP